MKTNQSPIFVPKGIEETILAGMARAIWVSAYADAYENGMLPEDSDHAGAGQDWMDHSPETPVRAYLTARSWADQIIRQNDSVCLWPLLGQAMAADYPDASPEMSFTGQPVKPRRLSIGQLLESDADRFGHYLAMQMMGSGVSWFDDHAEFPLTIPHAECPMWDDLKD